MTTNTVDPRSHTLRYRALPMDVWLRVLPGLDPLDSLTAIYLVAGPQTNRCGIYQLSLGRLAEDLNMSPCTARRRLDAVVKKTGWRFDEASRVLWITTWWVWNPPQNRNVLVGALKDLATVPDSTLIAEYRQHLAPLDPAYHETFSLIVGERYPERYPEPSGEGSPNRKWNRKSEQEPEQEKEPPTAVSELFDASFWNPYPTRSGRKLGRQAAVKKWLNLSEEDRTKVSIAVKHYAASPDVQRGIGVKDPHRWLRDKDGEPWRDWLDSPVATAARSINDKDFHREVW